MRYSLNSEIVKPETVTSSVRLWIVKMSSSEGDYSDFSSEDEAPEDISFKFGKETALNSIKSIKESLQKYVHDWFS